MGDPYYYVYGKTKEETTAFGTAVYTYKIGELEAEQGKKLNDLNAKINNCIENKTGATKAKIEELDKRIHDYVTQKGEILKTITNTGTYRTTAKLAVDSAINGKGEVLLASKGKSLTQ